MHFNCYFSAWQIAMRPGEIEKAGKVPGTWQWLWLWWSILLLPLLTLPNIRDLHSLHPMLQARQLYKQRGARANISISSTSRPACRIMPLQIPLLRGYFVFMFCFAPHLILRFCAANLSQASVAWSAEIGKLTCSQGSCESKQLAAAAGVKKKGREGFHNTYMSHHTTQNISHPSPCKIVFLARICLDLFSVVWLKVQYVGSFGRRLTQYS